MRCNTNTTRHYIPRIPSELNKTKKKEPTLSERTFEWKECRYGKRHSGGRSDSNTIPTSYSITFLLICQYPNQHFIHFSCIFIQIRVLRILRLCPAQARLNPAYRTRGTEPPETLRVVRLDPRSDSLTAPLRL